MVQRVERLETQLQAYSASELEVLEHREVQIVDPWTAFGVASQIAESTLGGLLERRCIEPPRDRALVYARIPDEIRAIGALRVVEASEVCGGDRDRETVLPGVDAVHLPAADDRIRQPGRAAGELLATAERQVVDEAADETVIDVEVRQAVVALGIVVVEESLPAVESTGADAGGGRLGIGALRPCIGERQDRPAPPMFELRVQRVVVRAPAPVAVDVDNEVG